MSTTSSRRNPSQAALRVSRYDQVSALLLAVLLLMGFITLLMLLMWLSTRNWWDRAPVEVRVLQDVGGGGSGSGITPGEQAPEEPPPEEMPELKEPPPEQLLESITSLVLDQMLQLDTLEPTTGSGKGSGSGMGDGRGPGPGGPGSFDGIPAWERWEVRLSAANISEYAKQLDFFGVEIAVAGGGNPLVTYVKGVSGKPVVRTDKPQNEKRLRFMHRTGPLRDADRSLVKKAGVDPAGRVTFQFYSEEMYKRLLTLENIAMGQRSISDVRRTIFEVRSAGGKYDFVVVNQQYRDGTVQTFK